jgi:hypothetical protein
VTKPRSSRHLAWGIFEARIEKGVPSVEPVEGTPLVHLVIEEHGRRISARLFTKERISEPSPLAEVSIRQIGIGSKTAVELSTGNPGLFQDFYALVCQIADRIQIDRQAVSKAVTGTLASWSALLKRKKLLSENEQIGLIGELLFLRRVAATLNWETAARSWFGPRREEHDFVLPTVDVEVKTTILERRLHRISSLKQLVPKKGRNLFFVSVQLTPGSSGRNFVSLPDIATEVLACATQTSDESADLIRARLESLGWSEVDHPYYVDHYTLRTPMETTLVNKSFPALVPQTISRLGREAWRIEDLAYSINVDGLGHAEDTKVFQGMFRGGAGASRMRSRT